MNVPLRRCLDLGGKGTWDEFSRNGVKNIMAYSWPSHCKKVLESLESEKRFLQQHKVGCYLTSQHLLGVRCTAPSSGMSWKCRAYPRLVCGSWRAGRPFAAKVGCSYSPTSS